MFPLNLAHRGFSGIYPENTMLAFSKAVSEGDCDGLELDVHFSKDGELMVMHDRSLERTTTGTGYISDYTYDDLMYLDAGIKFDARFAGERIPKLIQVLELVKNNDLMLNIELKNYEVEYPGIERAVVLLIKKMNLEKQVFLSSFNHISIAECKRSYPEIRAGILYHQPLFNAEKYCVTIGADTIHPHYGLLQYEKNLTERCRAAGLCVNTWTVNEEADMEYMVAQQVDSIITNFPNKLSTLLKEHTHV